MLLISVTKYFIPKITNACLSQKESLCISSMTIKIISCSKSSNGGININTNTIY